VLGAVSSSIQSSGSLDAEGEGRPSHSDHRVHLLSS
jgi:hypothetical protein